jgi:hypothetical protein
MTKIPDVIMKIALLLIMGMKKSSKNIKQSHKRNKTQDQATTIKCTDIFL